MIQWINRKRNKKGFTLIELIVVIAILGILAAIAIPRFTGVRENANVSNVESNLRNIQSAVEIFATEQNIDVTKVQVAALNLETGAGAITVTDSAVTGDLKTILGALPEGPATTTYSVVNGVAQAVVASDVAWPTGKSRTIQYGVGLVDA